MPRDSASRRYSATGFPFAEGDARMEATLTNNETGEPSGLARSERELGGCWSPAGERVASIPTRAARPAFGSGNERRSRQSSEFHRPAVFRIRDAEMEATDSVWLVVKVLPGRHEHRAGQRSRIAMAGQAPKYRAFPPVKHRSLFDARACGRNRRRRAGIAGGPRIASPAIKWATSISPSSTDQVMGQVTRIARK